MNRKKIISILLTLCMFFSNFQPVIYALDTTEAPEDTNTVEIVEEAIDSELMDDVEISEEDIDEVETEKPAEEAEEETEEETLQDDQLQEDPETDTSPETEPEEDHPWYKKIWNSITTTVQDVAETVTHTAQKAIDSGKDALSKFTDAVSVFVIAYCAIPIFVVFLLLWLLKILFGINITIDVSKFNLNKIHRKHKEEMLP